MQPLHRRGNLPRLQHPSADGVVNVVVDIGDAVGQADNASLPGGGDALAGVAHNALPDLVAQVQALAVLFQNIHHPQALLIVPEGPAPAFRQGGLPRVAEGGVAQVVAHGDGLGQVLVEP